ncbi:MAG: hypothetical protein WC708_10915 [Lentisphaeria bacterium]
MPAPVMEIYVSNLSYQTDEAALRELFAPFGEIRKAMVIKDRETGQSRGFGFVEMPDPEAAQRAIAELSGKPFQGRTLNASEARPRTPGSSAPGGSSGGYAPRPPAGGSRPSYGAPRTPPPGNVAVHPLGTPPPRSEPTAGADRFGENERPRRFSKPPPPKDRNKRPSFEDLRMAKAMKGLEKGRRQSVVDDKDDEEFIPPVRIR